MRKCVFVLSMSLLWMLQSCGTFFNQPYKTQPARIGEVTEQSENLKDLPKPTEQIIASVYKFRDQTGQYKAVEGGSSFSTAVTQGATSILLKAMEDSGWFVTIERENQNNLFTERQLIRSSQQQFLAENPDGQVRILPALIYADLLLEGGIVSFDSNIITGGYGLRYFGAGGSTRYREDRVTVYLRAVSTKTGEILKTVYTSKTLLSQSLDGNMFRYVKFKRLLEAEAGITYNEPSQMAVTEAIEKALESLIIEGIDDGLWSANITEEEKNTLVEEYNAEKEIAEDTKLFDRHFAKRRSNFGIHLGGSANQIDGDLSDLNFQPSANGGLEIFVSPHASIMPQVTYGTLDDGTDTDKDYLQADLVSRVMILPFEKASPYLKVGPTLLSSQSSSTDQEDQLYFGGKYSIGLEYLPTNKIGLFVEGGQTIYFKDDIDNLVNGKRDDFLINFGAGVGFYLGKNEQKSKPITE